MVNAWGIELSIAVCAGLVLATLVTPLRRAMPSWFEGLIWLGLIVSCWLAITGLQSGSPQQMTETALWGAWRVALTSIELVLAGFVGWMLDHRFAIASWFVLVAGADSLLLALLDSRRQAAAFQPRMVLGEWFELPVTRQPAPGHIAVTASPFDAINRRGAEIAVAGVAAASVWLVHMLIWTRDVVMPNVAASQAATLRKARQEYRDACAPVVTRFVHGAGSVVDFQSLLKASKPAREILDDETGRTDRLAS